MSLIDISPPAFDLIIALAYATPDNIPGKRFYRADARPYLHPKAVECLHTAIALARPLGYRLKIFDAYRPVERQWALWNASPDPDSSPLPPRADRTIAESRLISRWWTARDGSWTWEPASTP